MVFHADPVFWYKNLKNVMFDMAELAKWHITYVFLSLGKFHAVFFFFFVFVLFFSRDNFCNFLHTKPFQKGVCSKSKKKKKKNVSYVEGNGYTFRDGSCVRIVLYWTTPPHPPPPTPTIPTSKLCLFRGSILFSHCPSICPFIL